ncbi:MAG: McrC family protein [Deltaproteobacteria bacterium]|jgi:5-methylcytosine-specific restriction enzyme subunit McrC
MRHLVINEHRRVSIGPEVSREQADQLRRFDDAHAARFGGHVFDWSGAQHFSARSYVGVVEVPGLSVEILPKIDRPPSQSGCRHNVLYMLEVGGGLRARRRSTASLQSTDAPLLDAFASIFADTLLQELQVGFDRGYTTHEANLSTVRGRLVLSEHARRNAIQQQRVYVRYDEFTADTALNRTLKAAARHLVRRVRSFDAARRLREVIARFDEVTDVSAAQALQPVLLTRQNERFRDLLDFARLVLAGGSPQPIAGAERSFSLLFPMYLVFERFIAGLLRRHVAFLAAGGLRVVAQARGVHLAHHGGDNVFELQPDVLGLDDHGETAFVLDTKWKVVDAERPTTGVNQADAYQMFAYAERFRAPLTTLLYPSLSPTTFDDLAFAAGGRKLRVATLDLSGDLRAETDRLTRDVAAVLSKSSPPN